LLAVKNRFSDQKDIHGLLLMPVLL
jgi:hypothetical protein